MQIRKRGGQTEYLRATYDPEKKRSVQKLIKPEDFTPEEKAQAEKYEEDKRASATAEQEAWAARQPDYWINLIAAGINAGTKPNDESALWESIKNLQKALRKAGIRRPIPEPKPVKKAVKKTAKRKPRKPV